MKFLVRMTYQKEDYEAFARLSGKTMARVQTIGMRLACFLIGILAIGFVVWVYVAGDSASRSFSWIVLIVAVIFLCFGIFFYPYQAFTIQRRQPKNVGETVYTFKENSFHMESGMGEQEYGYDRLLKVYETEGHLFLMVGAKSALVLPKRCCVVGTPRGLKEFLEKKTGIPVEMVRL